jgi:anti-anti-sigma factor
MTDQRELQLTDADHVERLPFDTAVTDDDATMTVTLTRRSPVPTDAAPGIPVTVVAVGGDIDRGTAPLLQRALSQALLDPLPVCCELSRVLFFDAAAANTIMAAHVHARKLGRGFSLCGVRGMTAQVLAAVDPDEIVPRQTEPSP